MQLWILSYSREFEATHNNDPRKSAPECDNRLSFASQYPKPLTPIMHTDPACCTVVRLNLIDIHFHYVILFVRS